jgi:putative transposase
MLQRHTVRLPSWDYSWLWWYYLTMCTHKRECIFGEVTNEKMMLNALGRIVEEE